jgi:alpha-L-fucosidase
VPYWPEGKLVIRNIKTSDQTEVSMLGVPGKREVAANDKSITITVPALTVDTVPCQHAWSFKITDAELLPE